MSTAIITAPGTEPITLDEAKAHLRVDLEAEDTLIEALITAAREQAEAYLKRALVTQTWELYLDEFPEQIDVPFPPLQSVTSIVYVDDDGVDQTLDTSTYTVDAKAQPGRIVPAYDESWPSTRAVPNAVTVQFVAGYGAASAVPLSIKQAMLLMIGDMYENRESFVIGQSVNELPLTSERLLWPYRVFK
jgi:uncharacterized phiE125 gp8 family phage protein